MNKYEKVDEPAEVEDPDGIECEGCGGNIGHDQVVHSIIPGYNMHGTIMDMPHQEEMKVACTKCMSKVFGDVGRICRDCGNHMTWTDDGWECQKGGCMEGA